MQLDHDIGGDVTTVASADDAKVWADRTGVASLCDLFGGGVDDDRGG